MKVIPPVDAIDLIKITGTRDYSMHPAPLEDFM
jgi:hypothetical protein